MYGFYLQYVDILEQSECYLIYKWLAKKVQ